MITVPPTKGQGHAAPSAVSRRGRTSWKGEWKVHNQTSAMPMQQLARLLARGAAKEWVGQMKAKEPS
jgi:hypothetical protein